MASKIGVLVTIGLSIIASASSADRTHMLRQSNGGECNQDILDTSFVTQCGPSKCEAAFDSNDTQTRADWPSSKEEVVQIISSRESHRFKVVRHKAIDTDEFYYEESHVNGSIFVEPAIKYQRILGFGTTLTDAACTNVDDLSRDMRQKLIDDYFNPDSGIGLNLLRVPIGSTKYSYSNYVLDQPDNELVELSPYDLDHRIPLIKDVMKSAGRLKNRVKLIASADGAPAEMKQNNKIVHGGYLRQDKFIDYATYLMGFISAYKTHGLSIWSLILGESPASISRLGDQNDKLDFSSLAMRPSDAIRLIQAIQKIRASNKPPIDRFRLLLLGDSRTYIPVWADAVLRQPEVANSVAGLAYNCKQTSAFEPYDNLVYATKRFPNKYLLASQGSNHAKIRLGNWRYAENYVNEIVKNLEFGSVGWIDFNMALNLEGGPCINERFKSDAAVLVDPKRGFFYRNPMFYAVGHLSRYVKPGSVRVKIVFHSSAHMLAHQYIAFVTPDNYLVVFVANNNIGPMPVNIGIDKRTKVESLLETKSFNTFLFRL